MHVPVHVKCSTFPAMTPKENVYD